MGSLTAKQVKSIVSAGMPVRKADGRGLYLVVPEVGEAYWALRYTALGKRRQMTIGKTSDLTLADARSEAELQKRHVRGGTDPIVARQRAEWTGIQSVEDLFADWYTNDIKPRLKHPQIPKRLFENDIAPVIGRMRIQGVSSLDIREIIQRVNASGRPTVANDVLGYTKQLFRHAIKLGLVSHNPATPFTVNDAGGIENSRRRHLSPAEIKSVFAVFREHRASFGRDNYLCCCLFLVLGVRKSELCEAMWSEFELEDQLWHLPASRSKTGSAITIPLPTQAVSWLQELHDRSFGSEFVFPARRSSKIPHMGPDTLNRAISKLFGREAGRKIQPPNRMGEIEHFTIHDLRRTFRSLLSKLQVHPHVAERCLNHKLQGVIGIYDRHDYLSERKIAHQQVADYVYELL
ncbi:MAG: integrase [Gammaproteobacteria bacterium]|nr:integrase [Gammaproteobacteria bacterium]MBJ55659.1 integrase [Gammaproteobacteria bacterium]HBN13549.1 integrase [Pseudohongiella sp.]|tara:strand:- start:2931 stop:4145 length:1215 start_codon:yes stop_codon:yes gene_type:complete